MRGDGSYVFLETEKKVKTEREREREREIEGREKIGILKS